MRRLRKGSNRQFSIINPVFKKACQLAQIEPTKRQASKFRNEKGSAFQFNREAIIEVSIQD